MSTSYAEQRLAWRKSLTDNLVRDLAYDYKIGRTDDCSVDAWAEFQERFGDRASGPQQEFTKKRRNSKAAKSPGRRRKGD